LTPLFSFSRFLERCKELFPYKNKKDNLICDTEKMHSIVHAGADVMRWGDPENMSAEAPETGHKEWVKKQGGKTNQGPQVQLSMMKHTLRKEASELLGEAIEGADCRIMHILYCV
jgi:hypothetical protein